MMIYQGLAILILLMFYACYFLKMMQQRRQGIRTDQMGRGKTGFVLGVEITLKVCSILVPLAEVVSIGLNASALPAWARIAGIVLGLLGDAAFVAAVLTMRDSWRAGVSTEEKTDLVTSGIYSISRNPAFLGFDLVYIGVLCMFCNVPLLVITAAAMLAFHLQIVNVEEPFLQQAFGEAYMTYSKRVRRYLGRY